MIKKGFTLAETMVTLGIIGLLAAILIPVIINAAPDNNKIMFKKAYYTLERTITFLINDDENYPTNTVTLGGVTYLRGFNNTNQTTNTHNKFCYFLSDTLNTVGTKTLATRSQTQTDRRCKFTTTDGLLWKVYIPVSDSANTPTNTTSSQFPVNYSYYTTKIVVDVDGPDKGANCTFDKVADSTYADVDTVSYTGEPLTYCKDSQKADQFIFGVRFDGKIQVGTSIIGSTTITDQNAIDILSSPTKNE